jgi:hypothetical protein
MAVGCGSPFPSDVTIYGDSSLVGATVSVDGAPSGTLEARRAPRAWLVERTRHRELQAWPGQAVGDTVFRSGATQAIWSGKLKDRDHMLACRGPDGRELKLLLTKHADVIVVLASFRRDFIHAWVESY